MSFKIRTNEFAAAISSLQARRRTAPAPPHASAAASSASPNLADVDSPYAPLVLHNTASSSVSSSSSAVSSGSAASSARARHSEFSRTARDIADGIQSTSSRLELLGRLAKRKTLFDDRPHEIGELTAAVKTDITLLNSQIRSLKEIASRSASASSLSSSRFSGRQESEHSENVVVGLQNSLARTSQNFAELLEVRTETLRAQKERRDQYSAVPGTQSAALALVPAVNSPLYSMSQRNPYQLHAPSSMTDLSRNDGGGSNHSSQAASHVAIDMQMTQSEIAQIDMQAAYLEQRNTAVESIEQTIGELAQIFQQLGTLVAQQREQVMRIDDNVVDIESNVDLARRELFKYWTSMSSNRTLMVKVFAVVLFFFFIFLMAL